MQTRLVIRIMAGPETNTNNHPQPDLRGELPLPRADLEDVEVGRRSGLHFNEVCPHLRRQRAVGLTTTAAAAAAALPPPYFYLKIVWCAGLSLDI